MNYSTWFVGQIIASGEYQLCHGQNKEIIIEHAVKFCELCGLDPSAKCHYPFTFVKVMIQYLLSFNNQYKWRLNNYDLA